MLKNKYFTYYELTKSDTAKKLKINNTPNQAQIENINNLLKYLLIPLREKLNKQIIINSCFRSEELNKIIGGVSNSQHCKGQAIDIHCKSMGIGELYNFIKQSNLTFDQLINEKNQWVHLSYNINNNRNQCLLYNGKSYSLDK